jgi:hypothetical protein
VTSNSSPGPRTSAEEFVSIRPAFCAAPRG